MEGEGPPFGWGPSPSKPPSSPRTSLHGNRRRGKKKLFSLFGRRLPHREVFGRIGRCAAANSAASRLIGGGRAYGECMPCVGEDLSPSSVANAPASPQGEAFCTLCEHGKYDFELRGVLTVRFALIRRLRRQTACSFLPPRRGRLLYAVRP